MPDAASVGHCRTGLCVAPSRTMAALAMLPASPLWPKQRAHVAPMRWRSVRCTRCSPRILHVLVLTRHRRRLFLNPLHASPALVFGQERVAPGACRCGPGRYVRPTGTRAQLIDWPAGSPPPSSRCCASCTKPSPRTTIPHCTPTLRSFAPTAAICWRSTPSSRRCMQCSQQAAHGDWREWSLDLRDPASAAVAVFAASHEDEVRFHCFLQWLADRSLAAAQEQGAAGRHAHRTDRRPRGWDGPDRQSCLEPSGRRAGWARHRGATGPVQSARAELGTDRLFATRSCQRRLCSVPGHCPRGAAHIQAACESITPWE